MMTPEVISHKWVPNPSSDWLEVAAYTLCLPPGKPGCATPFTVGTERALVPLVEKRSRRHSRAMFGIQVPQALQPILAAVEASRWILGLPEDWDGEGSVAYTVETWNRAIKFLLTHAVSTYNAGRGVVPIPAIENGPEGSIDLYWKSTGRNLLINFPSNPEGKVTYYGSHLRTAEVKGDLDLAVGNDWLFMWLLGGTWQAK